MTPPPTLRSDARPSGASTSGAVVVDDATPARRRRPRWWVVAAVVAVLGLLAVLGGTRIYAQYLAPEAAAPLSLADPVEDTDAGQVPGAEPTAPSAAIDVDGTWQVAQGSVAGYRLDEVLSGVETTVVGRTLDVTGSLTIEGGMLTAAEVVVLTETIETDEPARDAYFRRAVDSDTFPEATFVLSTPVDVAAVGDSAEPVTVLADGIFTFHGVSSPVTAELQVNRTEDGVGVFGTIPVVLADHGLEAPDLGFVTVQPEGEVEVLLRMVR